MCQSQQSMSCSACLPTTYRLILQACGCCSFWQNQCSMNIFPLAAIYGRWTAKASLPAFWLITRHIIALQAFLIIKFKPSLTFVMPTQGCHKSVTTSLWVGWMTRISLITLPPASAGSNKGQQSLPLGTLALLVRPTGLMVTQTTEVNKN